METARCKAFLAAAEEGSLTAAGDRLGYTPSGVSQLITALEDDLGLKLLERTKKGVGLTKAGEEILPVIRHFLSDEDSLYEKASDIKGLSIGNITVAAFPSIATFWLPELISKFQKEYPNIDIRVMEGITQEINEWIKDGTADMAILSMTDQEDFDWYPLQDDRMVAVISKEHPLAYKESFPMERLSEEDFIMPALGHDLDVEALFVTHEIKPKIAFTTMENPVTLSMIKSGLGISVMNELCTGLWKDQLKIMPLDPPCFITFGVAVNEHRHLSPASQKFLEYVVKKFTKSK
ncbi:MAG: LysR family transcriptional regulator [Firmicutes bacterium]|nr:LysR family transcriptional regulator [Bacillota bacterium]